MSESPTSWNTETATWKISPDRIEGEVAVFRRVSVDERVLPIVVATLAAAFLIGSAVIGAATVLSLSNGMIDLGLAMSGVSVFAYVVPVLWLLIAAKRTSASARQSVYLGAVVCSILVGVGMLVLELDRGVSAAVFVFVSAALWGLCIDSWLEKHWHRRAAIVTLDSLAGTLQIDEYSLFLGDVLQVDVVDGLLHLVTARGEIRVGTALDPADWSHLVGSIRHLSTEAPSAHDHALARRRAEEALGVRDFR